MSYILIAEDDTHIQLLMKRRLESSDLRLDVRLTGNGEDALKMVLEEPPSLVVLDILLPGMTGLDVCRQIKQQLGHDAPPVIIVSALGHKDDVDKAFKAGADDYMIKPFLPSVLVDHIKLLI